MIDYHIRFFDTDYEIPDVDLTKCGLQDTWKIEKIPAIRRSTLSKNCRV